MTIITPTGIAGITSITSTGNTLQFQNASGNAVNVSGVNVTSGTDINVSGIVTASGFVGTVTGNITGNLSGNVTGNVNATGVSTLTTLISTNISGVSTAGITTVYTTSLRGTSNTITIPTGHKLVGTDTGSVYSPGSIVQVITYDIPSLVTFASSGYATGYTTTITPIYASSKLLHMFWAKTTLLNSSSQAAQDYRVTRNGTLVWSSSWQNYFNRSVVATDIYPPCDFIQVDTPATTSTLTYNFDGRIYGGTSNSWTIGEFNGGSGKRGQWTILEIAV